MSNAKHAAFKAARKEYYKAVQKANDLRDEIRQREGVVFTRLRTDLEAIRDEYAARIAETEAALRTAQRRMDLAKQEVVG